MGILQVMYANCQALVPLVFSIHTLGEGEAGWTRADPGHAEDEVARGKSFSSALIRT